MSKFLFFILLSTSLYAQENFEKLLRRYDPQDKVHSIKWKVNYIIQREATQHIQVFLSPKKFSYKITHSQKPYTLVFKNNRTKIKASPPVVEELKLNRERVLYLRNVYQYLLGLPMVISKDLQYLQKEVQQEELDGKSCSKYTIIYPQGPETWEIFFDSQNELYAYRFYKKSPKQDGETIYLEHFKPYKGLLVPTIRKWYWNHSGEYFRKDSLSF